jgi:hypothetical protein
MQQIFVSNGGNDENDGLTRQTPVRSWKRVKALCKGNNEMFLMEGDTTLMRLKKQMDEAAERVDFGEGALASRSRGVVTPTPRLHSTHARASYPYLRKGDQISLLLDRVGETVFLALAAAHVT